MHNMRLSDKVGILISKVKVLDLRTTISLAFILIIVFNIEVAKTKTNLLAILAKSNYWNGNFFDCNSSRLIDLGHKLVNCNFFYNCWY